MFPVESKILIVDDSSFSRMVLKNGLRELNFNKIVEAESADVARGILLDDHKKKTPVHLLISDVHMPEMSGLELLRWVRANEKLKSMPVIILTTIQEKDGILDAGKMGVSHYMIKPFDVTTLKERLSSTWDKHGQKYFEELKKAGLPT